MEDLIIVCDREQHTENSAFGSPKKDQCKKLTDSEKRIRKSARRSENFSGQGLLLKFSF